VTQRQLPLADPDEYEPFSPPQLAKFALHESLWRTAWAICMDPSPSVTDKLDMLHRLSTPEYRKDPVAGADAARTMMADHDNHFSYQIHMSRVLAAFGAYAAVLSPKPAEPKPKRASTAKIAVNIGGDERF